MQIKLYCARYSSIAPPVQTEEQQSIQTWITLLKIAQERNYFFNHFPNETTDTPELRKLNCFHPVCLCLLSKLIKTHVRFVTSGTSQMRIIKDKSGEETKKRKNEQSKRGKKRGDEKVDGANENNNRTVPVETWAFCHAPKSKRQLRHLIGCNRWPRWPSKRRSVAPFSK